MGWKGFRKGVDEILHPPYLRGMTPKEKEHRERRSWRHSELFYFFQGAQDLESTDKRRDDAR